jgi:hypothetical protein
MINDLAFTIAYWWMLWDAWILYTLWIIKQNLLGDKK